MKKLLPFLATSVVAFGISVVAAQAATFTPQEGYGNILVMEGDIVQGDGDRFLSAITAQAQQGYTVDKLILASGGGIVSEAVNIAAFVHAAQWSTGVAGNDYCMSMCMLIFAAGKDRTILDGARLGVHSAVHQPDGTENDYAKASTIEVARVMSDYGAPSSVIAKMITTPGNDMAILDERDLTGWVATYKLNN